MKEQLNYLFSRHPRIYESILQLKGNTNFEKVLFLNLIKKGDVVFDIGANRGYYTLLFSHLVNRTGQVHAFEPVPPTFGKLSIKTTAGKRFNNVCLNCVAVGDITHTVELYMPGADDGQASLTVHTSGSWKNAGVITTFNCESIRLDDYCVFKEITRLNFIKCDIEGAELLALKGASKTIAGYKPIIYLEICRDWTANFGYDPVEIVRYLNSFGYSAFHLVTDSLTCVKNPDDDLSMEKLKGSANLMCSIPEKHSERTSNFIRKYTSTQ
jgi:FkbM family methyltransferase